jgi:phosphoglycerol geranylgeranyltransferase
VINVHVGKVEKKIYSLREEHPLVIPQLDPERIDANLFHKVLKQISDLGVKHLSIGSSLAVPGLFQQMLDVAINDFDFSVVTYPTNSAICFLKGTRDRTAIYWMSVLNAENPYYLKDVLIMNSSVISDSEFEPIPTSYVFDDRGKIKTANWLSRSYPVPRDKPEISLAIALAAQYLGMRFYIMGGGSNSGLIPPVSHLDLLAKKTNLFLIPTSGIATASHAETMFQHNADAIHVGTVLEKSNGMKIIEKMVKVAKKYPGKQF